MVHPRKCSGARRLDLPPRIKPQLATLRQRPPSGPEWIHEIKHDGYRMFCRIDRGKVSLFTRQGLDWTKRLPELVTDLSKLPVKFAWLDGEVAAILPNGVRSFSLLQNAFRTGRSGSLTYWPFDLLYLDGHDLRACALVDRKTLLASVLEGATSRVRLVEHIEGNGAEFFARCRQLGLEGIVSKLADARHCSGRSANWLKMKCRRREDFVIIGYLNGEARRNGLGALLLGTFAPDGTLTYEGRVGTGFSNRV